jgi:hypothetical protein
VVKRDEKKFPKISFWGDGLQKVSCGVKNVYFFEQILIEWNDECEKFLCDYLFSSGLLKVGKNSIGE